MRLDDIVTYLAANNASYVAALTTIPIPLVTLVTADFVTRDYQTPTRKVQVLLDNEPEEVDEFAPTFRIVSMRVKLTVFVSQSATESVAREQARNYAQALLNCLRGYSYFFSLDGREDYEGVEGKPDIKATQMDLTFKYEEAI